MAGSGGAAHLKQAMLSLTLGARRGSRSGHRPSVTVAGVPGTCDFVAANSTVFVMEHKDGTELPLRFVGKRTPSLRGTVSCPVTSAVTDLPLDSHHMLSKQHQASLVPSKLHTPGGFQHPALATVHAEGALKVSWSVSVSSL